MLTSRCKKRNRVFVTEAPETSLEDTRTVYPQAFLGGCLNRSRFIGRENQGEPAKAWLRSEVHPE